MERVWIFADWKLPDATEIELIHQLGFTDVVLGLVGTDAEVVKSKFSLAKIKQTAAALKDIGVEVHVMSWIRRDRKFIADCAAWMTHMCTEVGAASGLLDAESDWHKGKGISADDGAALAASAFANMPCPFGVTGLSNLHATVLPLLKVADYGLGQAYSIWTPTDSKHWSHDKATEPYEQQKASWASWSQAGKKRIMGLSNYYAARPKRWNMPAMSAEESLRRALQGAVDVGAAEVAYWSLKWLKGEGESREAARRIIRSIPKENEEPPIPPSPGKPDWTPGLPPSFGKSDVEAVQWLLVRQGLNLGKSGPRKDGVDGEWGEKSSCALDKYRASLGLKTKDDFSLGDAISLVNDLRKRLPS